MTHTIPEFDCVILGAGLVGAVAALRLAQSGLRIAVVEARAYDASSQTPDHRTTAIAYGSMRILDKAGVWSSIAPHTSPIARIRTLESGMPFTLDFDDDVPSMHPMGYMVNNGVLRDTLSHALSTLSADTVKLYTGVHLESVDCGSAMHTLHLSNALCLKARMVMGSEGRHSPSRAMFEIRTITKEYGQTALVTQVRHEKPHHHTAFEIFHPTGPLAFLPMPVTQDQDGNVIHKSAIVWSCTEDLEKLDVETLNTRLFDAFDFLGSINIDAPTAFYPLTYQKTSSFVGHRYALMGDAAHVMHPVAGQGVNLGWRDADILCDQLIQAAHRGLDIGSDLLLNAYARHRRYDQLPMMYITHSLIKLFGIAPKGPVTQGLRMLRAYGLGMVNRIPPLKKFLMNKAMGV